MVRPAQAPVCFETAGNLRLVKTGFYIKVLILSFWLTQDCDLVKTRPFGEFLCSTHVHNGYSH